MTAFTSATVVTLPLDEWDILTVTGQSRLSIAIAGQTTYETLTYGALQVIGPFGKPSSITLTGIGTGTYVQAPSGVSVPVVMIDISSAQQSAPTAAMLASTNTLYQLNAVPYTIYQSNGTALVSVGGGLSILSSHIFADNTARDTYFTANPTEKTVGVFISVGSGFQQWNGTTWVTMTAVVQGPAGTNGTNGTVGAGYTATSTSSLATAGSGSKSFATQAGLAYAAGARLRATSAATAEYMEGLVTSYASTTLVVTMDRNSGTGTHADWNINVVGDVGATGASGAGSGDMLAANNLSDVVNKATGRTNLGVAIGTDVVAYSHVGAGGGQHANSVAAGAAGFMTGADKTKLDGVAAGATANSSDATLLGRANHTGTQLSSTISDFTSASQALINSGIAGLAWKQAVRAATTANGTDATAFANGQVIDGVTLATGDRILRKNQTTASENGIFIVNASGAPTRATDGDSGAELVNASVMVSEGTVNADTQWTCTTNAPITPGSTSLAFAQFTGGGPSSTDALTEGSTNKYYTAARVRAEVLTGIDVATAGTVAAADSVLVAIGKLEASKVTKAAAVDVSAVATLTIASHANRHLYSTTDANPVRALPSSGQGNGDFVEYKNGGTVRHSFTGGNAAPGMALYADPGETIQFAYTTQWDAATAANPSSIPLAGDSSANYTTTLADAGKRRRHPASDANARTFTIDGTLAYPDGTCMTFPNRTSQVLSIALTGGSGTLRLAGSALTGTRAVAQHGHCTVMLDGGDWLASGPGVT